MYIEFWKYSETLKVQNSVIVKMEIRDAFKKKANVEQT